MSEMTRLWFVFRVLTGQLIHVLLIVCALYNIDVTYDVVSKILTLSPEATVHIPVRVSALIATVSVFFAAMAGVFWVKSFYIQHFLPEVLDEVSRKISEK